MASIADRNKNIKMPKKTREEYVEDALYREVWEEVNNEKTLRFVKKYWRLMVAVAIILMIGVTGFEITRRHIAASRIAAAVNYETAVSASDANALAAIGERGDNANADLAMFKSYLIDHDITKLEKLVKNGATRDMRDLARMHIVGQRGDDMDAAEVEKYLSELDTKKSPYYFTSRLVIAQKYLSVGDRQKAEKFLDKIINDADAPAVISAHAQMLK